MKKYDVVKLIELTEDLKKLNLQPDFYGVIISSNMDFSEIMFFNNNNIGESTICKVKNTAIKKADFKLPQKLLGEIDKYIKENYIKEKDSVLTKPKFKECDCVKVIVEKDRYSKYNVHCGDIGYVMIDEMVDNEMLVDFTYIDENGDLCGEEVSVNINDLKLVE